MKLVVAIGTAFVCLCSPAQAVTAVDPDGRIAQPFHAWANASKVPVDADTVTFVRGIHNCGEWAKHEGLQGCADSAAARVVLRAQCWTTRSRMLRRECRFNTFHELGHLDEKRLLPAERERFAAIVGVPNDWASPDPIGPPGRSYLKETYADGFALCAIGKRSVDTPGLFVSIAASRHHRSICRLLRFGV